MNTDFNNGYERGMHYFDVHPELLLSFLLFLIAFVLIAYAVKSWFLGRIFAKAGISRALAWVPVYNNWLLLKMGDQPGFWSILMVIPYVQYVAVIFLYIAMYRVTLKFNKEGWWVVFAILLPIVWYGVLAFDDSKWNENELTASSK